MRANKNQVSADLVFICPFLLYGGVAVEEEGICNYLGCLPPRDPVPWEEEGPVERRYARRCGWRSTRVAVDGSQSIQLLYHCIEGRAWWYILKGLSCWRSSTLIGQTIYLG